MDTSYYDLDMFGVNTEAIHDSIRKDIVKVLNRECNSYEVSCLFNFDYFYSLIQELSGNYFEIEDFNGWEMDFYEEFYFNEQKFCFHGGVFKNSYKLEGIVE